jgi:hypothetical protein
LEWRLFIFRFFFVFITFIFIAFIFIFVNIYVFFTFAFIFSCRCRAKPRNREAFFKGWCAWGAGPPFLLLAIVNSGLIFSAIAYNSYWARGALTLFDSNS